MHVQRTLERAKTLNICTTFASLFASGLVMKLP